MNADLAKPNQGWMRLSEAAEYLGVHFSTLRRWTDDGKIPCFKTPGGRRRYRKGDLDNYLNYSRKLDEISYLSAAGEEIRPEIIREIRQIPMREETWYSQISEENTRLMAQSGRRLIGTLMQYVSRVDGGEEYLQQGRKLARRYGKLCLNSGLTVNQTMRAFVSIRHSIVDSLCESGMVVQDSGEETWNIYRRVNYFLDAVMLAMLDIFQSDPPLAPGPIS